MNLFLSPSRSVDKAMKKGKSKHDTEKKLKEKKEKSMLGRQHIN
jgi:hypothetical protein